jgi:hypothetical protein
MATMYRTFGSTDGEMTPTAGQGSGARPVGSSGCLFGCPGTQPNTARPSGIVQIQNDCLHVPHQILDDVGERDRGVLNRDLRSPVL